MRLGYPKELNLKCPLCEHDVKYVYANGGKIVHTLNGDINQIVNLYKCTNGECEFHDKVFNPAPRFDYGGRYYGADVFRLIADEFLIYDLKSDQIYKRLTKKYQLSISPETVNRMCDDVLMLKSLKIDEKTLQIIREQGYILLGLDGQDPGGDAPALWNFMDLISNRVLATRKFDSLDYKTLHRNIEEICEVYGVKIIGWVSDKQNVITKCHDEFYADIPHQYCQYHFLRNTWNHLAALDSNIYMLLKKTITGLYIHTASKNTAVYFENVGKVSVRKAFKNTDKDLQVMIKARNKVFKELRGIWLYEKLTEYVGKMDELLKGLNPNFRFTKILNRTAVTLREALKEITRFYDDICELSNDFQQVRQILGENKTSKEEKVEKLGISYDLILTKAKKRTPELKEEDLRSFLPDKKKSTAEILGEWYRLWESYRNGLFEYYGFPELFKTNMVLEHGFSKEKQAILNRVAKGNISHMVATRGEDYLRIKHCTIEELEVDIVEQYSEEIMRKLRANLSANIKEQTAKWRTRSRHYEGLTVDISEYYQNIGISRAEGIIVG
ncbi:hypothetical protein LCGC14_1089560 [marine sediment metagenome]|uniref:MULE transposase domain-containing protein n=1 Tax=marine sediment metagenome TaxID=412755 RepID=A0A0F9PVW8_9ZZZZ